MLKRKMTDKKIMWLLLSLMLTFMGASAASPSEALDRFLRQSGVRPESIAVIITDLSDGKVVVSHNSESPLVPASIMKSVTTAALLDKSGVDFRYHTPVYIDGNIDMGILRGNLVVEGSADPSLNSNEEPVSRDFVKEITAALKTMGVHRIEGRIIIDESGFAGPSRPDSWAKEDHRQAYGTGSHAFNFSDNASGRRSVENPSRVFIGRLKSDFSKNGIIIDEKDLGEGKRTRIFDHVSPTVDEIMRSCMMRSDNMFAESMLRTFGKLDGGDGSTENSAKREFEMWKEKKMPLENVVIIDGSGLSRSNRVTADFMSAMLVDMSRNPDYASFFPLAGQEGTLKSFLAETPLDSYIAMKTGSMRGIQCYAGYKLDDDYAPTHSVVIIMNDITGSRDRARKAAEKMLLEIFSSSGDIDSILEGDTLQETEPEEVTDSVAIN